MTVQDDMDRVAQHLSDEGIERLLQGGVCDFCCLPPLAPIVFVAGGTIDQVVEVIDPVTLETGKVTVRQHPLWGVCVVCAPVVRAGDADALAEHVVARATREIPAESRLTVMADLRELYENLFKLGMKEVSL